MKFLLDHDVPEQVGQVLRYWGHEAIPLKDVLPVTASDEEIFQYARSEELRIVTCN